MEIRKIIALGQSSRAITLPKVWLERNKLETRDRVSLLVQRDGSLVVRPSTDTREDMKKLNLIIEANESEDSIIRRIIGSYMDGYNTIRLTSERIFTLDQQNAIRRIVGILYRMIIESEASKITLETLIDETKASIRLGIERMHMISYSMCRDVLNSLRDWNEDLAKSVISLENDVDQLMFLLLRLIRCSAISPTLANEQDLDPLDCLDYQTIVHRIERIADHATSIANSIINLIESRISIPEEVLATLIKSAEIAISSYDMAVQCFLSKDTTPTNGIIDKQKEIESLYMEITPIPHFGSPNETSILYLIINIRERIMRISQHAANIAELTINRAYKSESF